jgi:hypothetical protein
MRAFGPSRSLPRPPLIVYSSLPSGGARTYPSGKKIRDESNHLFAKTKTASFSFINIIFREIKASEEPDLAGLLRHSQAICSSIFAPTLLLVSRLQEHL